MSHLKLICNSCTNSVFGKQLHPRSKLHPWQYNLVHHFWVFFFFPRTTNKNLEAKSIFCWNVGIFLDEVLDKIEFEGKIGRCYVQHSGNTNENRKMTKEQLFTERIYNNYLNSNRKTYLEREEFDFQTGHVAPKMATWHLGAVRWTWRKKSDKFLQISIRRQLEPKNTV